MTFAGPDSIRIQAGDVFWGSVFPDVSEMAFAVSIDRRRIGGDIPAGAPPIFPIPDPARK
ncbi:hypothetical protein [Burkholderia cenocepacia]|uniref:hypothetical protein n=1 Tax=Burkholderia cenocepacia TaxID=95486 RepID=UPI000F5BC5D5|nr:hypothetical protein [Burkholderia cenocepacia]